MSDKFTVPKKLTIATHFYNNEGALQLQLDTWRSYPDYILEHLEFIVVDDHSDIPITFDHSITSTLSIRLFRVDSDIAWNQAGCRNLIFQHLRTPWALLYDVDHIISSNHLQILIAGLDSLNKQTMYRFKRKQNSQDVNTAVNCYLAGSEALKNSAGYDEDFCGYYGFEDVCFVHQWQKNGYQIVQFTNVVLNTSISRTRHLNRDLSRNEELLQAKLSHSEELPGPSIRFSWHEALLTKKKNIENQVIEKPVRLQLGKKFSRKDGFLYVDDSLHKPDIDCDIRSLQSYFTENSVHEIYAAEIIENFMRNEVVTIIKQWVNVLKPDGILVIDTPNLIILSETLLNQPVNQVGAINSPFMKALYGDAEQTENHHWLYTPYSLAEVLQQAGLVQIQQVLSFSSDKDSFNMRVMAVKSP